MPNSSRTTARQRRKNHNSLVTGILLSVAVMAAAMTFAVFSALSEMARTANRLDQHRTGVALTGALQAMANQFAVTIGDYTNSDEAFRSLTSGNGDWIDTNIGETTENPEIFDSAIILDGKGSVVVSYVGGIPMRGDALLGPVRPLVDAARLRRLADKQVVAGYVETPRGLALAAAGVVRMADRSLPDQRDGADYVMIAMRLLNKAAISRMSDLYVVAGLEIVRDLASAPSPYSVPILDMARQPIARLQWTPTLPGDESLSRVQPVVQITITLVGIFFLILVGVGAASTRRLRAEEAEARKLAHLDRLSGLYNRAGLFAELDHLVRDAATQGRDVALIYLDLDGFKEVNDSYGHATGDQLIRAVAAGLSVLVPEECLLARLGGDEFAAAFIGGNVEAEAQDLAETMLAFFAEPFVIGDRVAGVGASIGIAASPRGITKAEELVRRADMAMYRAKESGRGRAEFYVAEMDADRAMRNALELDLRLAIETRALDVVFQPVVDSRTHRIRGIEALARWNRQGHGPVPPDIFIPIAEKSGLIDSLGLFVLHRACTEIARWPGLRLSVNVSPGQFRNPAFVAQVAEVLTATAMDPSMLTLEVTESYFIQNPARARSAIEQLKGLGVQVALDDFGAGFSSIGYLRQFGFNRMKIDRTLINALETNVRGREMLHATVALARSLDIPVTAEGIEREEQAYILELCGCDELQGYYFGRPASGDDIDRLLQAPPAERLAEAV